MTHLNATAGSSNTRPLTTKPMDTADTMETPSGFATLTNGASLDPDDEDQEDDSTDWEEVDILGTEIPKVQPITEVEVTLGENHQVKTSRKTGTGLERRARLISHKLHTVALLASSSIRNRWINHQLLHARLLSITPLALQTSFLMIHKKTQPDPIRRARLFESALFKLAEWWHSTFRVIPNMGVRCRSFAQVQQTMKKSKGTTLVFDSQCTKGKGEVIDLAEDDEDPWSDRLRSPKSLMKHALLHKGSAETSSMLFTSLCRALDIPARLVVSLQSCPWSSKSPTGKSEPPLEGWPPIMWTEVFSRPECRWIPVDPIRYLVDKRKLLEPTTNCPFNRLVYVVAFEEDGYARDVTLRYATQYGARTMKSRLSSNRGQENWWLAVIGLFKRPYHLNRDDVEDAELQSLQYIEGMPASVSGFKDHPMFALTRHLRRDEVIYPLHEIGKFRGEPVYPRANVQRLKAAEGWMREGRMISMGQQPLKRVKARATTIERKRMLEMAKTDDQEEDQQGLYAKWQTEPYVPEPVVDGRVPKNNFGNIDLYVPSMLPQGAVYLPMPGVGKIAKEFAMDFAEAVVGFEFRKGRANPIIQGIVVAEENEETLRAAYQQRAEATEEKERQKKYERVIKRWIKLVQGLRIRQRLKVQYGDFPNAETPASDASGMDERHVVQPYHLPRQKYTSITFQDNGQADHLPGFLPHEVPSEKDDEMKTHPDSLQINRDVTPPPSSTTRGKTRIAPRRSGRRAPGKRRKITSSPSENDEEPSTRRTMQRTSIPPVRSLNADESDT